MPTSPPPPFSRRQLLATSGALGGLSLPAFLQLRTAAANENSAANPAKACIIVYLWGGMSHLESFDLKPDAPTEIRGEFAPIATAVPGIDISEHLPHIARHTDKLAIVRSIHHDDSAHGRGMYWNLTGHRPPRAGNIPPTREEWPSIAAVISKLRAAPRGVPAAVRLPYPFVDNNTLQAGEYGGWLGVKYDPILIRTPTGEAFGGVSRNLGSETLNLDDVDVNRLLERRELRTALQPFGQRETAFDGFEHFHALAEEILSGAAVKRAYDLNQESPKVREMYGPHLGGQSLLLARRLVEAGVPVVQVCCAAGDLNGGAGDMWDTHSDNFNRLKGRLLPVFDRGLSALLQDLTDRGTLGETLVVVLTDFGRTPRINRGAGRDHYPDAYSIAMAGGGIKGGQVSGSTDSQGAFPKSQPCTPPDVHATIYQLLGINPKTELRDHLNRPFPICDGEALPVV
jgi:hypothetical protein